MAGHPSGGGGAPGRGDGLRRERPRRVQARGSGISLPGTAEDPRAPVYMDGSLLTTLKGDTIVAEFLVILDDYVARRYPAVREAVR